MKFYHTANAARKLGHGDTERLGAFDGAAAHQLKGAVGALSASSLRGSKAEASSREFRLLELAMLSLSPILRHIHNWWLQRAERHYLICADVEQQRAREAQMNVAYYQKRAALARSARH
ncbi:hypothetical protein [Noviherbaspirillum galbum]|uniref:Uncharacterized protein n=1 Tax=Noviherbaspirillum galbum TaxID=2709383 RepID=A0A6B3SN14_9BURK|nr:hypothetical protein [Noviherbaspirillum galbum]NEX59782.1 hypothetical protein [Noviherbaspirillum galbum]